jgi:hypothetical protein
MRPRTGRLGKQKNRKGFLDPRNSSLTVVKRRLPLPDRSMPAFVTTINDRNDCLLLRPEHGLVAPPEPLYKVLPDLFPRVSRNTVGRPRCTAKRCLRREMLAVFTKPVIPKIVSFRHAR